MDLYTLLAGIGGGVALCLIVGQVRANLRERHEDREEAKKREREWLDRRFAECATQRDETLRTVYTVRDQLQEAASSDRAYSHSMFAELDKRLSALSTEIENTEKGVAHLNRRIRAAEKVLTDAGCGWGDDHGVAVVTGNLKSSDALDELAASVKSHGILLGDHFDVLKWHGDRIGKIEAVLKSGDAPKTLPQAPAEWYRNHEAASMPLGTHEWPKNPKV